MAEEIKIIASAVGFDQVQKGLNGTTTALKKTADEAQKTGQALSSSLKPGANQAGQSLTNLGRIAQDAPFGFIGITNNIDPLLQSFQQLKKETGSTGGAFKALFSSLAGPAGLGLAISVVTSALTFASIGFDRWGASAKKAKEDTDEFQKGLDNAKSAALSTAQLLEGYVKIARDQTLTEKERNQAIREANKILGEHGEKLTLANIATEKVTETVKLYTQATIAQAIAQKYSDKIADLVIKKNELLAKAQTLRGVATGIQTQQTVQASKLTTRAYGTSDAAALNYLQTTQNLNDAQAAVSRNAADIANVNEEIANTQADLNKTLKESTFAFGELGVKSKDSAKKTKKAVETIESVLAKLRKDIADENILARIIGTPRFDVIQKDFKLVEGAITTLVTKFNLDPSDKRLLKLQIDISNLQARLKPAEVQKFAKKTKDELEKGLFSELKDIKVFPDLKPNEEGVKNLKEGLIDIGEDLAKTVEDIGNNIAQSFGDTLGKALTGEATFGDFFKNIFAIIGQGLQDLGKQFIIAAQLFAQIKKTLALRPELAVLAGIALIAVGGVIKNLSSQNAFAVGTRNAPGGMALVGERGPELVNLPRGSQVIPAAQTSNMMGGVGGSVEVFGILRGQDIYFSNKKYGQTYGRTT